MRAKFLLILLCFSGLPVFGQTGEAQKRAEFGFLPCNYFNFLVLAAYKDYQKLPDASIYVVYYEGKNLEISVWNKQKNLEEKRILKPKRGNARNRAEEVPLLLQQDPKFQTEKIVLLDGGFRENLTIEIWLVPKDAAPPIPTPTINAKNVKFVKGKPSPPRSCAFGDNPQINY